MVVARPRPDRTNRDALSRMLRTTGLASMADEAPLVALLKRLAKKLDEGGGTRDEAMYLSALKDARRVLDMAPARGKSSVGRGQKSEAKVTEEKPEVVPPKPNDLAEFKLKRGIAS